jgi:N-acetylmuramoyl-L-alanine amidase
MPQLLVLKYTDMPACLVEMAFIDNDDDAALLADKQDEFARAIACGITDYECAL